VRYTHQEIEALPNTFVGVLAVLVWPIVAGMLTILFLIKHSDKGTLFGQGKNS